MIGSDKQHLFPNWESVCLCVCVCVWRGGGGGVWMEDASTHFTERLKQNSLSLENKNKHAAFKKKRHFKCHKNAMGLNAFVMHYILSHRY